MRAARRLTLLSSLNLVQVFDLESILARVYVASNEYSTRARGTQTRLTTLVSRQQIDTFGVKCLCGISCARLLGHAQTCLHRYRAFRLAH